MSWLSSNGGTALSGLGAIASFIPGGQAIGAGLAGLGGLIQGNQAQNQANKSLQQQKSYLDYMRQQYQAQLASAMDPNSYASAGPYDQYSPAWNEAATGAFRDDTAKSLQSQMAGIDYYLRPQGGAGSSAMQYAKAQAVRDAGAQNAAFMRNLRIQGGVERYNNAVKQSQDRFSRISTIMGQQAGLGSQYGQVAQQQQQGANDIYGGLASSIKAITALGLPGSKTGTTSAGNNTLATNQVFGAPFIQKNPALKDTGLAPTQSDQGLPGSQYYGGFW